MGLLICDNYGMHYVNTVVVLLVICQQQSLLSSESVNWTCVFVSLFTPTCLGIRVVLSSPLMCDSCVSVCICVNGAVSNGGRHDRVGKARERARGKGATCQAHPAGTRRPGAGHRTQQIWTLLRSWFRSPHPLARLWKAQHGPARNAPKQSGDCIGLIQQHLLTPLRDFLRINLPLNPSTPHLPQTVFTVAL